jgi:ribonuclease HI
MNRLVLFTDVSVNPQRRVGVGGYLLVPVSFLEIAPDEIERSEVFARLKFRRFAETSSTQLEVQTVLWALEDSAEKLAGSAPGNLQIYTDSQCVAGLLGRRAGLEISGFIAKGSGRLLSQAALYRAFYVVYDQLGFQLIKVPGHAHASSHDTVQRIFSYVDREVRKALALWMNPR